MAALPANTAGIMVNMATNALDRTVRKPRSTATVTFILVLTAIMVRADPTVASIITVPDPAPVTVVITATAISPAMMLVRRTINKPLIDLG
jgi:hypothetical protein